MHASALTRIRHRAERPLAIASVLFVTFPAGAHSQARSSVDARGSVRREASPGPIAWGPVMDGLQGGVRLEEPRAVYAPGAPIWEHVYLRNLSGQDKTVKAIGGYETQGAPRITTLGGGSVKVVQFFGEGFMLVGTTRIPAGEIARVGRVAVAFRSPTAQPGDPAEVAPGLSFEAREMAMAVRGPGAYLLRQTIRPWSADGKLPVRPVETGALRIQIGGAPAPFGQLDANAIPDISRAAIAWGPAHNGIQAGLMAVGERSSALIGERVRLVTALRNTSLKPISIWHQTSFAFLDPTIAVDAAGRRRKVTPTAEPDFQAIHEVRMTGVTTDMTSAPSAAGPSRLRRSEIAPGEVVIGYFLTSFVAPPAWSDGPAAPGRYQLVQPIRLGFGSGERLNAVLHTGGLPFTFEDPGLPALAPVAAASAPHGAVAGGNVHPNGDSTPPPRITCRNRVRTDQSLTRCRRLIRCFIPPGPMYFRERSLARPSRANGPATPMWWDD